MEKTMPPPQFDLKHVEKCPPKIKKNYWGKNDLSHTPPNLSPRIKYATFKTISHGQYDIKIKIIQM